MNEHDLDKLHSISFITCLRNLPSDHPLAKKIDQKPSLLLSYTNLTNDTPPTNKSNTNFNQKPYSFSNNAPQQTRSNSNSTSNQAVSDQMYKKEDVFVVDDFDDADLLAVDEDIFMHDFQKQDSHDLQKRDSRDFGKQDSQTKVKIEDYGTKRKHPPVSETLSSNTANFSQHTQHVTIKSEVEEIAIEALDKQNTKQISMVKSENPVIYYLIAIENDLRSNKITFPFTFHVKVVCLNQQNIKFATIVINVGIFVKSLYQYIFFYVGLFFYTIISLKEP